MIRALILDTETHCKDEPEVIELAYKELGTQETTQFRFKPTKEISWGALATHHILPAELDGLPPSDSAPLRLPISEYLIGHNIDFDWKALGSPEGKRICTLAMARDLWPEVDSHSLVALIYYTRGANAQTRRLVKEAHGAAADVQMCEMLLQTIMQVAGISGLENLYLFSEEARLPKIMTFGKYKGEPISAVDRGYMNWYRRQPDTDPYVIEAFRRNGM